jgi:surface protein
LQIRVKNQGGFMCKNWLIEALTRSEARVVNYDAELISKELISAELNSTELNSTELNSTELNSTELKTVALACKNLVSENINNHTQGSATTACPSLYFSGKGQHQAPLPITGLPITGFIAIGLMLCLLLAGLWATPAEAHGSHTTSHSDNSCYQEANIGTVGIESPCKGMLIVCFYDSIYLNDPNKNSCPVGKEAFSIHRPSVNTGSWISESTKNDYYKEVAGKKYYFGQHDGESQIFTGQVTCMSNIFRNDSQFNADISNWDTSQVARMRSVFDEATAFNQDIGGWDTSKVTSMAYMFREATAFNQDIGDWDTSQVANMVFMFQDASAFNQDLSHWNFSGLDQSVKGPYGNTLLMGMFFTSFAYLGYGADSALSVDNYDAFLINFKQERLDKNSESFTDHKFTGGSSRFCESATGANADEDLAFVHLYNQNTIYDCSPRITRVTLDNVLSTSLALTVTFSEPVFSAAGGALETDDFVVSITTASGSVGASLYSPTPTSISQNGNSYTLGVTISGTLQDDQVIKVLPVTDSIFDADGNAASDS